MALEDSFDLDYAAELRRQKEERDEQERLRHEAELDRLRARAQAQREAAGPTANDQQPDSPSPDQTSESDGPGFLGTIADIGTQVIGGLRDAGVEIGQTVIDFGGLRDSGIDLDSILANQGVDVADPETAVGGFARSTAQFLTGFVPALGALRVLRATSAVSKGLKAVRAAGALGRALSGEAAGYAAAGAVADFAAFDPHQARFSNLAKEFGFENAATDFLAADENDGELEGRLKNVLEGAGLGLMVDGLVRGLRFAKRWRNGTAKLVTDPDVYVPAPIRREITSAGQDLTYTRQYLDDLATVRETWRALGDEPGHPDLAQARSILGGSPVAPLQSESLPEAARAALRPAIKIGDEVLTEGGEQGHFGIVSRHLDRVGEVPENQLLDGFVDPAGDFLSREDAARRLLREGASDEVRAHVDAAELRAGQSGRTALQEFEDAAKPVDDAFKRESAIGQLSDVERTGPRGPQLADTIRRATQDTSVLDREMAAAHADLVRAEQRWLDVTSSPEFRSLPDDVRKELVGEVSGYRPERIQQEITEAQAATRPGPEAQIEVEPQVRPKRTEAHPFLPRMKITRAARRAIIDAIQGDGSPEAVARVLGQDSTFFARTLSDDDMKYAVNKMAAMFTGRKGSRRTNHLSISHEESLAEATKIARRIAKEVELPGGAEAVLQRYTALADNVRDARATMLAIESLELGYKENLQKLATLVEEGKATDDIYFELLKRTEQFAWFDDLRRGLATDLGRALNALGIRQERVQRIPALKLAEMREAIKRNGGVEEMQRFATQLNASLREGRANGQDFLRQTLPRRAVSISQELWLNNILSGPITSTVNVISNTVTSLWLPAETILTGIGTFNAQRIQAGVRMYGGMVEGFKAALRLTSAGREALVKAQKAQFQHYWDGSAAGQAEALLSAAGDEVGLAFKSALLGSDVELVRGAQQFDIPTRDAVTSANFNLQKGTLGARMVDAFGTVMRLPSRFLTTQDALAKSINYHMQLNRLAFEDALANGVKDVDAHIARIVKDAPRAETLGRELPPARLEALQQIHEEAVAYARKATFTEDLPHGTFSRFMQDARGKHPMLTFVVPFVRTPVNLLKFVGERTPGIGLLSKRVRDDLLAGGERAFAARSRMVIGTGLWVSAMDYAFHGKITGGGPRNPDERAALLASGWQPYSIRTEDDDGNVKYVAFNRLDPIGLFLGVAGDVAHTMGMIGEEDADELATALVVATMKNLTSKSYFTGITAIVDAINNPDRKVGTLLERYAGSLVPNFLAQGNRTGLFFGAQDDVLHEVDGLLQSMQSRIPGLSESLPPRRNLYGDVITYPMGLGPDSISPFFSRTASRDPVAQEVARLADKGAFRMNMRRSYSRLGDVELTPEQMDRYIVLASKDLTRNGMPLKDALNRLVRSDRYKRAGDGVDGRPELLRDLIGRYRLRARRQMLREFPELNAEVRRLKLLRRLEARNPQSNGPAQQLLAALQPS